MNYLITPLKDIHHQIDRLIDSEFKRDDILEKKRKVLKALDGYHVFAGNRERENVVPRNVYWYIMKKHYKFVYADFQGNFHHSTLIHGIRKVEDAIENRFYDPELHDLYFETVEKL